MPPMTKEQIEAARAEAMAKGATGTTPSSAPASNATSGRPQYENRSRLGLATPAIRPGMKARLLLGGPAGAGKTYTSLLIAMTLREHVDIASVVQIDTEKDSGRTYADEFLLPDGTPAYKHISWAAPYNAVDLAMTLRDASGKYDVVIIDSHSHFWRGQGGVLDVAGGRWTGWAEARPMHVDMIDAILGCDCHVILCARMTMEHEQVRNPQNGKIEVVKLGMKVQQDADLEYEVNVALEMDMNHTLRVTKSRTRAVPVGSEFIAGHAEEFGGRYREWLKGGEPAASAEQIENLVGTLNRITDPANRMRAKQRFQETFGRPEMLLLSRLMEAAEWVANAVLGNEPPPDRAPDATPAEPSAASSEEEHDQGKPAAATAPPDTAGGATDPNASPDGQAGVQQPAAAVEAALSEEDAMQAAYERGRQAAAKAGEAEVPRGTDAHEGGDGSVVGEMGGGNDYADDVGHCAACGAPIWRDDIGLWDHANDEDSAACAAAGGPSEATPAAADMPASELDALYLRAHGQRPRDEVDEQRRVIITKAVGELTQTKLLRELTDANLSIHGAPKTLKQRLVDHRLATA
jgi:hypothetical protein